MLFSKDEKGTLALSKAVIKAVRTHVPFSTNLGKLWEDHKSSFLFKQSNKIDIPIRKGYNENAKHVYYEKTAKRAVLHRRGLCDELVEIIMTIIKITYIPSAPVLIASPLLIFNKNFHGHILLLLHNKPILPGQKSETFKEFSESFINCKDVAVICDPWLWFTAMAWDYRGILNAARAFDAENYYQGDVHLEYSIPFLTNSDECALSAKHLCFEDKARKYKTIFKELQNDFLKFFRDREEIDKTPNRIPYEKVRETTQTNIKLYELQSKQLQELMNLIARIKRISSERLRKNPNDIDRKDIAFQKILDYCKQTIYRTQYIGDEGIRNVFKVAASVALIPEERFFSYTSAAQELCKEFRINNCYPSLKKVLPEMITSYNGLLQFAVNANNEHLYQDKVFYYTQAENLTRLY